MLLSPSTCASPVADVRPRVGVVLVQMTFEVAAEKVKTLKDKPSNDVLLQLYVRTHTTQENRGRGKTPHQESQQCRAGFAAAC